MVIIGSLSIIFGIALVAGSGLIYVSNFNSAYSMFNGTDKFNVKDAFTPMFYKDDIRYNGYLPEIDGTQNDTVQMPAGVTPDFLARFMLTQAKVQEQLSGKLYLYYQLIMTSIVLGAIGIFSILFGFALTIIQSPLCKLLKDKQ